MSGDLHMHTILSDGSNPVERLFQLAEQAGVKCISITDHDHLDSFERDQALGKHFGILAIHGAELSTYDYQRNRRVHILCYLPDDVESVREICAQTAKNRTEAGIAMTRLVAEKYPITLENVLEIARGSDSIFKQHIMLTLMNAGFATEMFGALWKELFDNRTGSCIKTCKSPDVWEVLPKLRRAGGICVLAHPYTYNSIDLLEELIEANLLDGIEVWSSKSNAVQEAYLLDKAHEHRLIPTGGSDFHGATASRVSPIGCAYTPQESIEALLALKR